MNFLFFAVFAVVFAGQSLDYYLYQVGPVSERKFLSSNGNNVVLKEFPGTLELVLNSDTTLFDTVSQKYLNIGTDDFVTLSNQPQTGYSIDTNHLVYKDNVCFGVLNGRFAYDRKGNFRNEDSWSVRVVSTKEVPDMIIFKREKK